MRVWLLDERCATFCLARGGEERPSSHSTWRLRPDVDRDQLEAGRRGAAGGAPGVWYGIRESLAWGKQVVARTFCRGCCWE
jgi:hypothetical protein